MGKGELRKIFNGISRTLRRLKLWEKQEDRLSGDKLNEKNGKRSCLLCGEQGKLSAEHKIKASLLRYFNNLQGEPDKILKFDDGSNLGGEFTNIKKAKNLRPIKNICIDCNGLRSQKSDEYFDKFIKEGFETQNGIGEIEQLRSPSREEIFREVKNLKNNLIKQLDNSQWSEMLLWVNSQYLLTEKYQIFKHSYDEVLIKKYLAKHTAYSGLMGHLIRFDVGHLGA